MDLKAYAIERKLAGHGDLLTYVTKGQAIPIDVLDQSFQNVLAKRHDKTAELLSNDYRKYLHQEVKMNFVKASASQMQVSGNIDDNVVDIIEAVHHVNKHEIVKETVQDVMADFNPHDTVKFDQIDLYQDAENFVSETQGQTVNDSTPEADATVTSQVASNEAHTVEATSPKQSAVSPALDKTDDKTVDKTTDKTDDNQEHLSQPDAGAQEAQVKESVEDTTPEENTNLENPSDIPDDMPDDMTDDMSFLNDPLPNSNLDSADFPNSMSSHQPMAGVSASNVGVNAQESQTALSQAYHQAYNYFRDELKKYKLDSRLPGLDLN